MFSFQKHVFSRNIKYLNNRKMNNVIFIKRCQTTKEIDENEINVNKKMSALTDSTDFFQAQRIKRDNILPSARVYPIIVDKRDAVVLSFDEVPGPKALKYIATCRHYLSKVGTQLSAAALTFLINTGSYFSSSNHNIKFSSLFDEYGPVVRFVNPVGTDIVLLNHPDHIQKVFSLDGEYPIRSSLESLQKFRSERNSNSYYCGIYNDQSQEWSRGKLNLQMSSPSAMVKHSRGILENCDKFTNKVYKIRNYQDEITKDLYEEIRKWAFDTIGLIMFSKQFSMLETDEISSQCDVSWMYYSFVNATGAILKCEGGLHLWKLFGTPAWHSLVKHCDNLDSLIGKFVLETEQKILQEITDSDSSCLTSSILLADKSLNAGDVATILMDMMLIGVNTIASSMSFLLYQLAKHQRAQRVLYTEIENLLKDTVDTTVLNNKTPYLQACIKESLRLVPPVPVITRILPKNIILDHYNIPRGTMIIMATQNASIKESNFDDASKFYPERWLPPHASDNQQFASLPFGFGMRKCLGQTIAENMLSLLLIKILQTYKLEYHYGDIQPTKDFIVQPKHPLKIRFLDRIQ